VVFETHLDAISRTNCVMLNLFQHLLFGLK
jgi:hypothetical protein